MCRSSCVYTSTCHCCCYCCCCRCVKSQTPPTSQRAAPYRPKTALLVTGQNPALTKTLSQNLIPKPRVALDDLLATSTYQQGFADDVGSRAKASVAGELLSLLGFSRLGTSSRIAVTVYLETAFAGVSAYSWVLSDVLVALQTSFHKQTAVAAQLCMQLLSVRQRCECVTPPGTISQQPFVSTLAIINPLQVLLLLRLFIVRSYKRNCRLPPACMHCSTLAFAATRLKTT